MTTTHADRRYATVDGLQLASRQYGADHDGVPVVLLSRFQGTLDDWDPEVLSRLTARPRVITFDNAGPGPGALRGRTQPGWIKAGMEFRLEPTRLGTLLSTRPAFPRCTREHSARSRPLDFLSAPAVVQFVAKY